MKKLLSIWLLLLFIKHIQLYAQSGANCFNTQFNNTAASLDMRNAYLLGYLCTMSYVDYLRYSYSPVPGTDDKLIKSIRNDNEKFVTEFGKKLSYLFTNTPLLTPIINANKIIVKPSVITAKPLSPATASEPVVTFDFISKCNPIGYDPEAIIISTPSTVYVVFRGTDRVACNVSSGYNWAEWMASDFKFLKRDASMMHPQIQGQVHRGMVESLMSQNAGDNLNFADELASSIAAVIKNKATNVNKKLWITGHSLGGAHAQLFAMFLKFNYSITAQGLYIYESPHPGNAEFVTHLNNTFGKSKIQRFEFGDDPIPTLPPQAMFFGRAGVRNYFKDYSSTVLSGSEQIAAVDDLKILCALGNLTGEQIPQTAKLEFPPLCPGSACFHHPTFILQAIRHQLNTSSLSTLPGVVPLPLAGDNCNKGDLTKAENNDLINNTTTAIENTISQIAWQTGNIANNLIGTGISEDKYKLVCYAFKNSSKKYLTWNGSNNSQLSISATGTVFNLVHKLTGGYQLFAGTTNMAADVIYSNGFPTGNEQTNNIIMKTKDNIIGDEETWYLFKVPNTNNTYAFYNWNTHKILDAPDTCLASGSCGVEELSARNNEPTQVWIMEKVN